MGASPEVDVTVGAWGTALAALRLTLFLSFHGPSPR